MRRATTTLLTILAATLFGGAALAGPAEVRDGTVARLATLERKFVGLAEAMPQGKYTWRPGEGVRSVSEVLLHVASANYRIPEAIGTDIPGGVDAGGMEKSTTDKAKITAMVKQSFAHIRAAVEKLSDADIDKAVKLFGRDTTYGGAIIFMTEHLSEHLGQTIAYARVNGVVPPWNQ